MSGHSARYSSFRGRQIRRWGHPEASSYWRRRKQNRELRAPAWTRELGLPNIRDVFSAERIRQISEWISKTKGPAPGIDGVSGVAISRAERRQASEILARAVADGTYRVGASRTVLVSKGKGKTRPLQLRNHFDRVIATIAHEVLTPLFEAIFHQMSYAFRPHRGSLELLARLVGDVQETGLVYLAQADVRRAFENVQISRVMDCVRIHFRDSNWQALVERIMRADDDHEVGIDQGSALSPSMLNLLVHHTHDLPILQMISSGVITSDTSSLVDGSTSGSIQIGSMGPLLGDSMRPISPYRYADDLAYLCSTPEEGSQILRHAGNLLQEVGLTLDTLGEEEEGVTDLRQEHAKLMGFLIRLHGGDIRISLGSAASKSLRQELVKAHYAHDPRAQAREVLSGWIAAYGPAFRDNREKVAGKVLYLTEKAGYPMLVHTERVMGLMGNAWKHWEHVRETVRDQSPSHRESNRLPGHPSAVPGRSDVETTLEAGAAGECHTDSPQPRIFVRVLNDGNPSSCDPPPF